MMGSMAGDDLQLVLARSADLRAASRAVVEHLASAELRPSVYIERGGRLRCQALLGYRHLLDGFPPWTGVIGRTFATETPTILQDVREDESYLQAHEGTLGEVCIPVRAGGRTVGVVNLEAPRPMTDPELASVHHAARALGAWITKAGGVPPESASARLVRHSIALAGEQDLPSVGGAILAAAIDVTPLNSAMLLVRASLRDGFAPEAVSGPLAAVLRHAPDESISALVAFTRDGCSAYTVAGAGEGAAIDPGVEALRQAGAVSLAVLPIGQDRILVVASDEDTSLDTGHLELLELLAAHAAACLRTAVSVHRLRAKAASDPLTGLGHHGTFHTELAEACATGAVGVLMVDIDDFKAYNDLYGHPEGDRVLCSTAVALAGGLRAGDSLYRVGGDEFAALLPGVESESALEIARRLHGCVEASGTTLTVSIGAAAAAPGETTDSVLRRADRALYAVKKEGRDGVALARRGGRT